MSLLNENNILLVFPCSLAKKNHWCHIGSYFCAEFPELEEKRNIS